MASSPPFQLLEPTVGTEAEVALSVSTTTSGIDRRWRCRNCGSLRWQSTSSTPSGRRSNTPSNHCCEGRCMPPSWDSTTSILAVLVTACTPWMIWVAQPESSSWKTRSICSTALDWRFARRRYRCRSRLASTRARVSGATSERPLRTLETVVRETPTSSAMVAIVAAPVLTIRRDLVIDSLPQLSETFGAKP
ncbi:hypothetical protein GCM10027615_62660 [Plantactinospora veratri]